MPRKSSNFLDYDIHEDINPKIKFNALLSATISTIMCLAAKCPVPKSNIETTKLFLSTITDDNGETPRNVKVILYILNNYSGPYDSDGYKEKKLLEKIHPEKSPTVSNEEDKLCILKGSHSSQTIPIPKSIQVVEPHPISKRISKTTCRRNEKEPRKLIKTLSSKMSSAK